MSTASVVRFAHRMSLLPPYLFGSINKLRMEKRWEGVDIIDLGMGNPTDPPPKAVTEKLCEVVRDPKSHRYPVAAGVRNLRREIARMYERDYGVCLDPENQVICTIGSKEGLSHLCLALVGPGDTVIVPTPAFPVHTYATIIAGGNVIGISLADIGTFAKRLAELCKSLLPVPKLLLLNFPHNPTGEVTTLELFQEAVKLAQQYQFMVVHDAAYGKITFDGYVAPSFLQVPGASGVGVEFGSFSKSFNMAGWRVGYCVGHPEIVQALYRIKGYYDYGIFSAIQVAALVALRDCGDDPAQQALVYEHRRDVFCEALARAGWNVDKPKGGMFVWARIPERYRAMGSMKFALELLEKAGVAVTPGIGFGPEGEGYLRLALVENEQRLRQAVRQIRKAFPA